MEELLAGLNEAQRAAVLQTEGPSLIVAGAGSGKTKVLTTRIAFLLAQGVSPFNILSLTFTNKAAREMRARIEAIVGPQAKSLWMGTFHSVFSRILRVEAESIGYPKDFTIYDTDDSRSLIRALLKEKNLDDKVYKPNGVHARISAAKNRLVSVKEYLNNPMYAQADAMARIPEMGALYQAYQERLRKAAAMDFDDLLFNTNVLFHNHVDILNKYQQKFHYILVDEYQDTNLAQYLIIRRLAAVRQNISVVGDDAQSIYAFRGADIQNILNFGKDYPDLKLFRLEENYRSTQHIVSIANSIIKHNRNQIPKNVFTSNGEGELVELIKAQTDQEEAKLVATSIFEARMGGVVPYKDFAILYRTNSQSRQMEEALRRLSIRYRIFGGLSFYQRKEIKDLVSYLRLVVNPNDEEAFKRVVNYPKRGIGDATVAKVVAFAAEQGAELWDVVQKPRLILDGRAANGIENFAQMILGFQQTATTADAFEVTNQVAKETGVLRDLYEDKTPEGLSRYENVQELLNAVRAYVDNEEYEDKSLSGFLQLVSLATDADDEAKNNDDAVTLMTIHSAKGLEFKHVYVVGIEEDLFPSQMALSEEAGLEEERRLFYVACTRAEQYLTLSYAMSRYRFGNVKPCEPSRFLQELDPNHLKVSRKYEVTDESPIRFFDQFKERQGQKNVHIGAAKAAAAPGYVPTPNFKADDLAKLQPGMKVEHQKFGFGKITAIQDDGPNRKAHITFDAIGEKTLMLSFAKLMIHEN
jgi:DNA helicase-2/ATP-dependent DNA helicase PcrA